MLKLFTCTKEVAKEHLTTEAKLSYHRIYKTYVVGIENKQGMIDVYAYAHLPKNKTIFHYVKAF